MPASPPCSHTRQRTLEDRAEGEGARGPPEVPAGTLILETEFETPDGAVTLIEF